MPLVPQCTFYSFLYGSGQGELSFVSSDKFRLAENNSFKLGLAITLLNSLRCFEIYPETFVTHCHLKEEMTENWQTLWRRHSRQPACLHQRLQSELKWKGIVHPTVL